MPRSLALHSRSSNLFQEIVESCDLFFSIGYNPSGYLRYGIDGMNRIQKAKAHRYERQVLQRFVERKLLVIKETGELLEVALTAAGESELFRLQVLHAPRCPKGIVCMVVFDIPESKKELRKYLRDFLRYSGFEPLQKSVWISPFAAMEPLSKLFTSKKVAQWVSVFCAEKFGATHK